MANHWEQKCGRCGHRKGAHYVYYGNTFKFTVAACCIVMCKKHGEVRCKDPECAYDTMVCPCEEYVYPPKEVKA